MQRLLAPYAFEGIKVLDLGCGDGFVARRLFSQLREKEVTAVDIYLTDELMRDMQNSKNGVNYRKEIPKEGFFDLVLLLDVLEHVKGDLGFLADLVTEHVNKGGVVLITVPAFQSLHSRHDVFLGHYRRYRLRKLVEMVAEGGLMMKASGYLFLSLLLPKLILFKLLNSTQAAEGVGQWQRGRVVTGIITMLLNMDNRLLLTVNRLGIKIPGLTGWVLCEKSG